MKHAHTNTVKLEPKPKPSPWALGKDVFGKYESKQNNLSTDRKIIVKEKIETRIAEG